MTVTYVLEKPTTGMTAFNDSSLMVKADATASSFLARTTGKLEFCGELNATLAGATLNLNAPTVISIKAVESSEWDWHNGHVQSAHTVAALEASKLATAMQQTKSSLDHLEARVDSMADRAIRLENHEATLSAYTLLMED